MEPFIVLHPREIAVVREHLAEPEILHGVAAVSVVGGERLPEDARFSYGFRSPEIVGIVMADGTKHRLADVQAVLVKGGVCNIDRAPTIGGGDNSGRVIVDSGDIGLGQITNLKANSPYIDEIDKYLLDKEKASLAAHGDEFYTRIHMQQGEHAELSQKAEFKRINPPSISGSVLGTSVSVAAIIGSRTTPVSVAYWVGHDTETTPVTCLFNSAAPIAQSGANTRSRRPFGIVIYGTSGTINTVEVDILNGCQLTIPASSVTLQVAMEAIPSIGGTTPAMNLSGMLSFFSVLRGKPVTKTLYIDNLAPNATKTINIPNMAQTIEVQRVRNNPPPKSAEAFILEINDADNQLIYVQAIGNNVFMSKVAIAGDARSITITNNDVSNSDYRVIFELGI